MKKLALFLALLPFAALAQQQPSAIDRVAGSLGQCISTAEQKVDQVAELQKQLAAAQARVKELEARPKSINPAPE
jgi:septal ring factor EnvC (AmiA/AmiB activator)